MTQQHIIIIALIIAAAATTLALVYLQQGDHEGGQHGPVPDVYREAFNGE